jgi:XapX domain-containing protein
MEMKVLFLSFVVGLGVGVLYGLIRVKSPAPPIVALLGLLGMVLGEQLGIWIQTKKLDVPRAAAVCLVGERYGDAGARTGAPGWPKRTWAENNGETRISS